MEDLIGFREIKIAAIGVGGGGCNTITRLFKKGIRTAETIAINTDSRHLHITKAFKKILIGRSITHGLGAGGNPNIGRAAAEQDEEVLKKELEGYDIAFISAGMGGGTGTGATPIVAKILKEYGTTVIGIVTYPFKLERKRAKIASRGIEELLREVDTLIVIDNNKLVEYAPNLPLEKAFELADEIMGRAVQGISDTLLLPSLINIDYADFSALMQKGGLAMISIGEGEGPAFVEQAIESTLKHPLLEVNIEGAKGALVHLEASEELTIGDAMKIVEGVTEALSPEAEVKIGARINDSLENKVIVTAIYVGVKSPNLLPGEVML